MCSASKRLATELARSDAGPDDHARQGILSRRSRRTSAPAGISLPWDAMSIKRMNIDEKARYLIGEAIMRRILKSERTPDSLAEIRLVTRWIETWLDADELHAVSIGTGLLLDDELAAELQGDVEPSDEKDDDIPL